MKAILAITALLATTTPANANVAKTPFSEVVLAAIEFMDAIGSDDKTALADLMVPEGVIFVHNRMEPDNPRVDIVPVADHLARWAKGTRKTSERMEMTNVNVDGDMAQVWGAYSFSVDGVVSHCGINSLSMVKTDSGWKVGNTSFTMVPTDQCQAVGAHWVTEAAQ
jgi:hypothetical protein